MKRKLNIPIGSPSYVQYAIIPLRQRDGAHQFFPPTGTPFVIRTKYGDVPVHATSERRDGTANYIHSLPKSNCLTIREVFALLRVTANSKLAFLRNRNVYMMDLV